MTNNPTIDGVSRELLLNKCACGSNDISFCYESPQCHWIRCEDCGETSPSFENKGSALDHWNMRAPAVERQEPAKWSYCPECGSEEIHHEEGVHKQCAECHQEWFSDLDYSDVVRKHLSGAFADKDATIAQLQARIAELESGRSDVIHQVRTHGSDVWEDISGESLEMCQCQPEEYEIRRLYTAPPAPVAVMLPERLDLPHRDEFESADQYAAATGEAKKWNECLDATAALNGVAK